MEQDPKQKPTPLLDREDQLYLGATGLMSAGAFCISPAFGLIACGLLLLIWPFVARVLHRWDNWTPGPQ